MIEKYEVINRPLTVGSYSMKPGSTFTREMWPYGTEALETAVGNARCKKVFEAEKALVKESEKQGPEKAPAKEPDKSGATKKEKSE
jgi:hypothetical protein